MVLEIIHIITYANCTHEFLGWFLSKQVTKQWQCDFLPPEVALSRIWCRSIQIKLDSNLFTKQKNYRQWTDTDGKHIKSLPAQFCARDIRGFCEIEQNFDN